MKRFLRDNGLTLVLGLLFVASLAGQALTGLTSESADRAQHGEPALHMVASRHVSHWPRRREARGLLPSAGSRSRGSRRRLLNQTEINRRCAPAPSIRSKGKLDLVPGFQAGDAAGFHRRDVDEHIPVAPVIRDETKSLCRVVELDRTASHANAVKV